MKSEEKKIIELHLEYKFGKEIAEKYLATVDAWIIDQNISQNAAQVERAAAILIPAIIASEPGFFAGGAKERKTKKSETIKRIKSESDLILALHDALEKRVAEHNHFLRSKEHTEVLRDLCDAYTLISADAYRVIEQLEDNKTRSTRWSHINGAVRVLFIELSQTEMSNIQQCKAVMALFDLFDFDWGKVEYPLKRIQSLRSNVLEGEEAAFLIDKRRQGVSVVALPNLNNLIVWLGKELNVNVRP